MSPLHVNGWERLDPALRAELRRLREEYAEALRAAARGAADRRLSSLSLALGRLLAVQARRPAAERGCSLATVSLAVDAMFPELRGWYDRRVEQVQRQRLAAARAAAETRRGAAS